MLRFTLASLAIALASPATALEMICPFKETSDLGWLVRQDDGPSLTLSITGEGPPLVFVVESEQLFQVKTEDMFYSAGVARDLRKPMYFIANWGSSTLSQVVVSAEAKLNTYVCRRLD